MTDEDEVGLEMMECGCSEIWICINHHLKSLEAIKRLGYEQGKKDLLKRLIAESFEYNEHKIPQERLKELMKEK